MNGMKNLRAIVEAMGRGGAEEVVGVPRRGAALIAMGALLILLQLDGWLVAVLQSLPRVVSQGVDRLEPFGHGFGTSVVIVTATLIAGLSWRQVSLLALASFGSGMTANLLKLLVIRRRPGALLPGAVPEMPRFSFVSDASLPEFSERVVSSSLQSFPSAHTAAAFGLAVGLGVLFPQGRRWWLLLAAGCGLQRVMASRHFPSDVLVGAGIGLIAGAVAARRIAGMSEQRDQSDVEELLKPHVPAESTERRRAA
jgi:membrane-associated phospholipid phosphatase